MKRALKITGWTLLGIVVILVLMACIAIWLVFTPARLTPIARQVAAKVITCEHEIGEVELTFFSTFPRFGLRADGILLINPMAGARNDTVLAAEHCTATLDVMEFLKHQNLHLHEAVMDNAKVNFYIAPDGTTNITGVLQLWGPADTTVQDTSGFKLPFEELQIDGARMHANYITFFDASRDTITASLGTTDVTVQANSWEDMLVEVDAQHVDAVLKGEVYAEDRHITFRSNMAVDLANKHFVFRDAQVSLDEYAFTMDGTVDMPDSIAMDLNIKTKQWQIQPFLTVVPAQFTKSLEEIDIDGKIQVDAALTGYLGSTSFPLITAHALLNEGAVAYKPMPYVFGDLTMDAVLEMNLNPGQKTGVKINSLYTTTKESAVKAKGKVEDLFGDMVLDLALDADVNIPDFHYFMPEKMDLIGHAQGPVNLRMRLDDLTNVRLDKGNIDADLQLTGIHYGMDSIFADFPNAHARIYFPNRRPTHPKVRWVRVDMETDQLDLEMATPLKVNLKQSALKVETGNMLSDNPVIYAAVDIKSQQPLYAEMDSMAVTVIAPKLTAYTEYNTQDTTVIPEIQMTLDCHALDGYYTEYKVKLDDAQLEAMLHGRTSDKSLPAMRAKLNTQKADVQIGKDLAAQTGVLALEAGSRYNPQGENFLLEWNPRLKVSLRDGILSMPERLPEPARIPSIDFGYSNREMSIENARVELGHSDLNLKGKVRQIGPWFRHEAILEGELDIVSDHCDANQLLTWFSADSGSEEKPAAQPAQAPAKPAAETTEPEQEPFLVPTDVDLALNTHMREVEIFDQLAKDLKGGLYVRDGKMILDEMGFVCHAAKLQLTAIYRTPRRNHIYVGLDYHMVDVNIDELMAMIPNLDQMVPMLSSFKGAAQFHLAAETYLNSKYEPKMSTLRGAASLSGKNMVVMDGETFTKISKLLMFNKKTENVIDSINAELTVYKNEIDVYPLCISMDNYMVALGGRHKTDMTFDYDINVLKPIYLGVHVGGNMDNLDIKLAKCKFAKDFRPHWYQKTDTQSMELRRMIKASMEKNVRIKSDLK